MARYGYSRGHVGNLVNEGIFPPPMRLGTIKFWPVEIVDLFEENLLKNYHKELEKQGFKIPDKKK